MKTFRRHLTMGWACATIATAACNDVPGKPAGMAGMPTSGTGGTPTSTSTSTGTTSTPASSTSTSTPATAGHGGARGGASDDDGSFPPGATIGPCVATKWTASALASAVADPAVNAIDGILVSRWSPGVAQTPGQYYQIDFGGYVRLNQIVLDSTGSPGD